MRGLVIVMNAIEVHDCVPVRDFTLVHGGTTVANCEAFSLSRECPVDANK